MKEIRENIKKSYEESKRIIQDANVEQRLVLFVGAGTSMDSGMPSWGSAIKEIVKRLDITENDKLQILS